MDAELKNYLQLLQKETKLPPGVIDFNGFVLTQEFAEIKSKIKDFEVRNDDVWVVSFPKSGTTWVQEMVWLIANNLDYEGAKIPLKCRYGFIEYFAIRRTETNLSNIIDKLNNNHEKRFIKSHLPWDFLPSQIRSGLKKPKIVYVMRDVRDVFVSYFHHINTFGENFIELEEFLKLFVANKFKFTPYWNNTLNFWNKRFLSNIFIIKYEDMCEDLASVISKIAAFLDTTISLNDIGTLQRHLSFAEMKHNSAVNYESDIKCVSLEDKTKKGSFIRKGKVGSHKEELREDMIRLLNVWSKLNIDGTDYCYDFED